MTKILTFDWDDSVVRYLVAESGRGGTLKLLAGDELPLEVSDESIEHRVALRLKQIVSDHKLQKARVIAGIGRGDVKSVELTVPTASDDELPTMVRNLALREFTTLNAESAFDFVAIPPDGEHGTRRVFAMLLPNEDLARICTIGESAGVTLSSIRLRPLALTQYSSTTDKTTLVASLAGQRLDVLVSREGLPVAARSLRIPRLETPLASCQFAAQELRRTLLAISSTNDSFDPTSIERLVVFEPDGDSGALTRELATAFDIPADAAGLDFAFTEIDDSVRDRCRFAALAGLILQDDQKTPYQVDFLHPRKPPAPANRRKPVLIAAGIVAVLIGGVGYYIWGMLDQLDVQNAQLASRLKELNELVKETEKKRRTARSIAAWENSRVEFLDEFRDLTLRVPGKGSVQVSRLTVSPSRGTSWTMKFDGVARDAATIQRMEEELRRAAYIVRTPTLRETKRGEQSVWTFQTTVTFRPRSATEYLESFQRVSGRKSGGSPEADLETASLRLEEAGQK